VLLLTTLLPVVVQAASAADAAATENARRERRGGDDFKNFSSGAADRAIRLMGAKHPLPAVRRVFILKMARTS
jgi:hypothetical protein